MTPEAGAILGMVPALAGLRADVAAPPGAETVGVPGGGVVVGWVLVAEEGAAGGARVDPVFLTAGRAWTPDQFRDVYGGQLTVRVGCG